MRGCFLGRIGHRCFHVWEGSAEVFARIRTRSVWTKPGTEVDNNGCMVDTIVHLPNLVDITGHTRVFFGHIVNLPLKAPPFTRHLCVKKTKKKEMQKVHAHGAEQKKRISLVEPDVTDVTFPQVKTPIPDFAKKHPGIPDFVHCPTF